ncbi:MAG: transposase [Firmicutes bacterium]|nr:transposase [Bacillota bacterium]
MDYPKRKINRLSEYDYSQNGSYFITICAYEKAHIFGDIVGAGNVCRPNDTSCNDNLHTNSVYATVGAGTDRPKIILSDIGQIIDNSINKIPNIYTLYTLDKYTIMPNHVHLILTIDSSNSGRSMPAPTISQVIEQFKSYTVKQAQKPIWQKGFYDHIIRDEKSYQTKWNYIDTNTDFWHEDKYH